MYVSVPGLLGSIQGLFSNAGKDPSIASRTGSYDIAGQFISSSPIIGRGFGTFLPKYWILDNAYLGLMIEAGAVGLLSLLTLIVCGLVSARQARIDLEARDRRPGGGRRRALRARAPRLRRRGRVRPGLLRRLRVPPDRRLLPPPDRPRRRDAPPDPRGRRRPRSSSPQPTGTVTTV